VGKVTDMSELFKDLSTFNGDIFGWDVGQVTTMKSMFQRASGWKCIQRLFRNSMSYDDAIDRIRLTFGYIIRAHQHQRKLTA